MNITVLYICKQCFANKVPVEVPARVSESLQQWMDNTMKLLAVEHLKRSPDCQSGHLDLMIPITGVQNVGGPVVQ